MGAIRLEKVRLVISWYGNFHRFSFFRIEGEKEEGFLLSLTFFSHFFLSSSFVLSVWKKHKERNGRLVLSIFISFFSLSVCSSSLVTDSLSIGSLQEEFRVCKRADSDVRFAAHSQSNSQLPKRKKKKKMKKKETYQKAESKWLMRKRKKKREREKGFFGRNFKEEVFLRSGWATDSQMRSFPSTEKKFRRRRESQWFFFFFFWLLQWPSSDRCSRRGKSADPHSARPYLNDDVIMTNLIWGPDLLLLFFLFFPFLFLLAYFCFFFLLLLVFSSCFFFLVHLPLPWSESTMKLISGVAARARSISAVSSESTNAIALLTASDDGPNRWPSYKRKNIDQIGILFLEQVNFQVLNILISFCL